MLKWIGSTNSPVIRFGDLLEAKAVIGQVKFQVGATKGVKDKAWVKTNDPTANSGWIYWMQSKTALSHGIQDGSIVHVTKNHQPLKPGEIDPETGKPAPAAYMPAGSVAPVAPAAPAAPGPTLPAGDQKLEPLPKQAPEAPKAEPEAPKAEPEAPKAPEEPLPPVAAKEPEAVPPQEEPPEEPSKDQAPEVVPLSTTKEAPKLKKKVPLGTVRYHSNKAGGPPVQVRIRATDDPAHPRGGWVYLMSVAEATKQGIHHDDVLSFTFTPDEQNPMKGKVDIHKDANGHIKKISTPAQFPKPEVPKEAGKAPEPPPEPPKVVEPVKAPSSGGVPPEKIPQLVAYLKGLPSFAANPEKFLSADGESTLFNTSMQKSFGSDWYDKWKEASGAVLPEKAKKPLLSYDDLPADVKKKLGEIGASKDSLLAQVSGALHSLGKASKEELTAALKLDPTHVQVALDHLKDSGLITKLADSGYSLTPGWTTAAAPEIGKKVAETPPAPVMKLPVKLSAELKAALALHDIEPDSDAGKIAQVIDAFGVSSQDGISKATKLSAFALNSAMKWLLDKNLVKQTMGGYGWGSDWTTGAVAPEPQEPPKAGKKKKTTEPEPESEPEPEKPKVAPSASQVGKLQLTPTEIPSVDDLKYVESGKDRGLGGTGEKHIYKDKKGHEWIFKVAKAKDGTSEKPFAAYAQETFSNIAMKVKSIHIPIKVMHIKGKMGTLQPLIAKSGDLGAAPSPASLTPLEREDVGSEHVLDWLMSQHDSFGSNLIRTKAGRIVGVDKEQGFRFFGVDKLSTDYKPNFEAHGEKPPYYNQFWKEWADKKFDFDPTVLKKYLDTLDSIDDDEFTENFKPYAESFWEDKPKKQEEFLNDLRKRKKGVRGDFEEFLTELYKQRTGQTEGAFTFAAGWVPGAKAEAGKPKKKIFKYDAATVAGDYGISLKPYVPNEGPNAGQKDPTKVTLKTGKGGENAVKLAKYIKELKLTPYVPPESKDKVDKNGIITGSVNNIACFHKKDFDEAFVEKSEEVGSVVGTTPAQPEYLPDLVASPHAHSNLHELEGLHHVVLPALGQRLMLDGGHVEGQHAKAKKFIDKTGNPYYLFQFKLREPTWKKISGGDKGNWTFYQANWDPTQHAFVESAGHSDAVETKKWVSGDSEVHLAHTSGKWTYMGSMYAKVRPKKGQTPAQALHMLLETVQPGLADKVLTPPSEEEREVVKLSRVLWNVAPKESDALPEEKRTVNELKKRLKKHGWGEQELGKLQEVEAFPGYSTWSQPGRHKAVAKGKLRYLFHGIQADDGALGIMRHGLLGIHERNLLGLPVMGASYGADVGTGSGDGVLTRVVTDSGLSHSFTGHGIVGKYQVLIAPTEVDRLDAYVHPGDTWGNCRADNEAWQTRQPVEDRLNQQQSHYKGGMEMSFRKGIARGKLLRMVCQNEVARKALIKQAKQTGIMQVNGVPIDDFVVVSNSLEDAYTKYVKPLGF